MPCARGFAASEAPGFREEFKRCKRQVTTEGVRDREALACIVGVLLLCSWSKRFSSILADNAGL
jgi:hypothetical protein